MTELQPHQQRVVDEKAELDDKLERLYKFFMSAIFEALDEDEKIRLTRQASIMKDYSLILGERIAAFK
jgi:phosphate uptake regulator